MKHSLFLLLVATIGLAQPPTPKDYNATRNAIASSRSWIDIDYAGDGIVGHRLDIFLPKEGNGPFRVVICIYGSAWFSNSSKAATFSTGIGQKLLESGFAVITVNHRSSNDAKFPAQINDVKAAIRFVRGSASKFSLDPSFIGITGWSSGGHLSAMAGVTSRTKKHTVNGIEIDLEGAVGPFTDVSSHVDAVVDFFGPTDFLIMDKCGSSFSHNDIKSPESSLIGGAIQENPDKAALANPITYVNAGDPPFLIIHGDKDPLVPHCESEAFYERLTREKVTAELVIISGAGHGPGVFEEKYFSRMVEFFKAR